MRERAVAIGGELASEPERIEKSYVVKERRLEPFGVVYLWPVSN